MVAEDAPTFENPLRLKAAANTTVAHGSRLAEGYGSE